MDLRGGALGTWLPLRVRSLVCARLARMSDLLADIMDDPEGLDLLDDSGKLRRQESVASESAAPAGLGGVPAGEGGVMSTSEQAVAQSGVPGKYQPARRQRLQTRVREHPQTLVASGCTPVLACHSLSLCTLCLSLARCGTACHRALSCAVPHAHKVPSPLADRPPTPASRKRSLACG